MNKSLLIVLLSFALVAVSFSQITWNRVYEFPEPSRANCVIQDSDGNYVVTGWIGDDEIDVLVMKVDEYGDTIWTRTYGGEEDDEGISIVESPDGGYVVAANTASFAFDWVDIWVLWLNEYGDTISSLIFGGINKDVAYKIINHSEGGYMISGIKDHCTYSVWILRLGEDCDTLWTCVYPEIGKEALIVENSDGTFFISISKSDPANLAVLKTSGIGESLWVRNYGSPYLDETETKSILSISFNGIVIAFNGATNWSPDPIESGGGLFEIDSEGEVIGWHYGEEFCGLKAATQTLDSGYMIARHGGTIRKYNTELAYEWSNSFGSSYLYTIEATNDGGFIIGGKWYNNLLLFKTDEWGHIDNIEEIIIKPKQIALSVSPNPFNSCCKIETPENTGIEIVDLDGRIVRVFDKTPIVWQPEQSVGSAIFLVRAFNEEISTEKKIIYIQ